MPEARRVTVAAVEEVPPGGVRIVSVDDRSVGIFNVGGTLYALANKCPHAGSPVCRGSVGGMSTADRPGGLILGLAVLALTLTAVNMFGGFAVTRRMLAMFRK